MKHPAKELDQRPKWNALVSDRLKSFPIYIQHDRCTDRLRRKAHRQPGVEIHISHQGEALFIAAGEVVRQTARQVIIVRDRVPHQIIVDPASDYSRTVICADLSGERGGLASLMEDDWLPERAWSSCTLSAPDYAELQELTALMEEERRSARPGWQRRLLSSFLEITVLLQRSAGRELTGRTVSDLIQAVIQHVQARLPEDLSLRRTAEVFGVGPEHLTRSFQREIHMSYYQYVLLQRALRAIQLMKEGGVWTLTEIALASGFSSSSHFSRAFRVVMGESPTEYRKQLSAASSKNE